jgi:hydroxymethylbilane synthase
MTVATGSARRQAQLLAIRPDFATAPIRGNVLTRMRKMLEQPAVDATILAAAGMARLGMRVLPSGVLRGGDVPQKLGVFFFETDLMLPCVGQGAIGLEIRQDDERMAAICRRLDHYVTSQCVAAERSFLHAMGGGCQTPVGAYAIAANGEIQLRAVAHLTQIVQRAEARSGMGGAVALGEKVAALLLAKNP